VRAPDISCLELTELNTDYLEQALPEREQLSFELHLVYCVDCQTFLSQMRTTVTALGRLSTHPLHHETQQALLTAFRARRAGG
jgi:Putative zinc-finger